MGMQGIDSRPFAPDACREWTQSRKTLFISLIAKLASKVKASISPYFGEADFAFASVSAYA